jgi:hypothetical protein
MALSPDAFYKTFTGPQRQGAAHDRNLRFGSVNRQSGA